VECRVLSANLDCGMY